jgi:uncharacterized protein
MRYSVFAPFEKTAELLIPHAVGEQRDGSHDISHIMRVWKNVVVIQANEGGDMKLLLAATLLHDCVSIEKNAPQRSEASIMAASKASQILADIGWDQTSIQAAAHAIEAHSFSAGIAPVTLEAKILQDSDRLDAIGMVGVARCFYIAGRMGSALYNVEDPKAQSRSYDDKAFAIDHFETKLFKLASVFQTETGARLADVRQNRLTRFLNEFMDEI